MPQFRVPHDLVCVDHDVLLCESNLSESIAVVIGMEGMTSSVEVFTASVVASVGNGTMERLS